MLRVLLLALALLAAQQSALAHGVWHAAGAAQSQQQDNNLCKLHDALGTVAGALDALPPGTPLCALDASPFVFVDIAPPTGVAPVPSSRDPPALP